MWDTLCKTSSSENPQNINKLIFLYTEGAREVFFRHLTSKMARMENYPERCDRRTIKKKVCFGGGQGGLSKTK